MSEAPEMVDSGFDKLRAAGRNLWLAGLGAVAEVEEGSRELFDRLVERGAPVEGKQKKLAETVSERAGRAARSLSKLVEETVEFESRGMLKRLNLMTREDVEILSARLESLSKKINEYAVRQEAAVQDPHERTTTKTTKTVPAAKASRTKRGKP
ncbi:MAG TPA: phasin family protein, partial [Thermoanaerobaculia bacterium]|nr:phasin family protein [Thermoanaerobaculia bacterium]